MSSEINLKVPKKGYKLFKSKSWLVFSEGIWHNNPIFGMSLGLCSTLAVTNLMKNAMVMGISVMVVLFFNSLFISLIRNLIPERVRMVAYMLIISTLVITVDKIIKLFLPEVSSELGPYVALIITNCIVMGRAEAFAINNGVLVTIVDSLGVGLGYLAALFFISLFRELAGFGSLFGFQLIPSTIETVKIFTIAPGAFFTLGGFILVVNLLKSRGVKK